MQNNELRTLLAQQASNDSSSSSGDDAISRKDEMLATLSANIKQLKLERDELLEQLKHQKQREREVHSLEQSLPGELPVSAYDEVSIL
jgi:uncharacterized protein with von Willebrand factor type A (vWA) domain